MAFDAYLKIEGPEVKGEATAKGFEHQMMIYSFSWGASNPVTFGQGTGGGAGKVSVSSFNVMKKSDAASPILFQACCEGHHYTKATVTLRKAGGSQINYLIYEFDTVFVESIQWSGSSGGDDTPTESLSLAYAKVTINYQPQTDKGAAEGKPIRASWDVEKVTT